MAGAQSAKWISFLGGASRFPSVTLGYKNSRCTVSAPPATRLGPATTINKNMTGQAMTPTLSPAVARLTRTASYLEISALVLTAIALGFRATLYWTLPTVDDGNAGPAYMIDLGLAMLLFATCLTCAGVGVAISLYGPQATKGRAYRAFFVGVLCFLCYDLVYPYVPRLV